MRFFGMAYASHYLQNGGCEGDSIPHHEKGIGTWCPVRKGRFNMKKQNTAPQSGNGSTQGRTARLYSSAFALPAYTLLEALSLWSWFWSAAQSSVKGWKRWWR